MRASTKKTRVKADGDDLLPEYDFTRAIRGKHARRATAGISPSPGIGHATGRSGTKMAKRTLSYLVRISREPGSDWGASVPDLPGCVATGKTLDSTLRRIEVSVELHLAGLREDGIRPPRPGHATIRPLKTAHRVDVYATVQVRVAAASPQPSTEQSGATRRMAGAAQVRETARPRRRAPHR
jgi:predicted RNase H-like HicB family nuclease